MYSQKKGRRMRSMLEGEAESSGGKIWEARLSGP